MTTSNVAPVRTNPGTVVSADGTRIAYQRIGDGPPVIVLPGAMNLGESWREVAEALADEYTVLLVDRRGYPPSEVAPGVSSFDREVADVRALVGHVGGSAHVLGHSYGGLLALHAALADPTGIRSLLLYEAPVLAGGPHVADVLVRYRAALAAGDAFGAIGLFLDDVVGIAPEQMQDMVPDDGGAPPSPEEIRALAAPLEHDIESISTLSRDVERWGRITVPTLLMDGADTWADLAASTAALAAVRPDAERVTWAGQTHFANMLAPQLVAETLRAYLGGLA